MTYAASRRCESSGEPSASDGETIQFVLARLLRGIWLLAGVLSLLPAEAARAEEPPPAAAAPAEIRKRASGPGLPPELQLAIDAESPELDETARLVACRILEFAATVDPSELSQRAVQNLSDRRDEFETVPDGNSAEFNFYFDMVTFPQRYAGRAVPVRGNVRRILSYKAPEGCSADTLYESWVYSADSAANPVIVLTTSLPEGMAPGEELFASVTVTGYFFKLFGHLPQQPERRAPLLLAAELGAQPGGQTRLQQVDPAWWTVVRDRTRGVREAETELYYRVLHLAETEDGAAVRAAAAAHSRDRRQAVPRYRERPDLPFNTFVDLFQHPEENHGQPVMLRGHVRAWKTYPAGSNPYRLETLHELWIYPEDGLQNPAVVITTRVPEGFPRLTSEDQVIDNVRVTGWFFKLYGYSAEDTARIAPMVLATEVSWFPADDLKPPAWIAPAVGVGALLAFMLLGLFLWRASRRDRSAGARLRERDGTHSTFDFEETSTDSWPEEPRPPGV